MFSVERESLSYCSRRMLQDIVLERVSQQEKRTDPPFCTKKGRNKVKLGIKDHLKTMHKAQKASHEYVPNWLPKRFYK